MPLGQSMRRVLAGFSERVTVRRQTDTKAPLGQADDRRIFSIASESGAGPRMLQDRFADYKERAKSPDDAVTAAVGAETWAAGVQMIMVTLD